MAITVVETQAVQASAASVTATLANAVQAGDLIVTFIHTDGSTTIASASDGTNGAYTQRASDSFFSSNPSAWLDFPNSAAVAAGLVITGTASGATKVSMHVWLIRGTSTTPFDVIAHQGNNGGANPMTSGATAGVAGGSEIILGGGDSGNDTYTAGTGFTIDSQRNDGSTGVGGEHQIATLTAGSTQTATMTKSDATTAYYMFCAVYKGAVAAVASPLSARQLLRPVTPTPRGRARVAGAGPLPGVPLTARERLVPSARPLVGRARVIVLPLTTPPLRARQRLVPVLPPLKAKAQVARAGPAPSAPVVVRGKLISTPSALRARAKVAGAGPLAATPLTARQKLVAVMPALRAKAKVSPFVPTLVQAARGRLVAIVRTPRSAARVAGAGPLAAAPLRAIQRLVRSLPRTRAAFNNFLQIFRPPTVGPGVVLVSDFRKNQVTVNDGLRSRVLVSDFRIRAVQEKDVLI